MAIPKAGEQYIVVDGDRLWWIARDVYGSPWEYPRIVTANPHINGRGQAPDGSPLIFEGDILWIPEESVTEESEGTVVGSGQENYFLLTLNDEPVPVVSAELIRTMDTGSDKFTAVIDPDNITETAKKSLIPFSYAKCTVRISGELKLTGAVYEWQPSLSSNKRTITITGYSKTIDLVDSSVNPPYEEVNVSLVARANRICRDMGVKAIFESGADETFDKVTAGSGEKRFAHLAKLAKERGLLLSNTPSGNPIFLRANRVIDPIGSITESKEGALSFTANFNGRKRYSSYRIVGEAYDGSPTSRTVTDGSVNRPRYFVRKERRGDKGTLLTTAEWERSKALADALTMSIPVDSWKSDRDILWSENKYVTVTSKSLFIPNGVDLLIRNVRYKYESKKRTAILDVVPREVFTGEEIPDIWSIV